MNCYCGKAAIARVVQKEGENKGKQFFSCASTGRCDFFCWVGTKPPFSMQSTMNGASKKSFSPSLSSSTHLIKIYVHHIEAIPVRRVWFAPLCAYDGRLVKFFSNFPSRVRRYDDGSKLWTFDFIVHEDFTNNIKLLFKDWCTLEDLPRFLISGFRKYLDSKEEVPRDISLNLSGLMLDSILPFQIDGVKFVIQHGGRAMIADEMGCGKTIQAIALIQHYRECWPVLIMAPPNLLIQWKNEIVKYCCPDLFPEEEIAVIRKATDHLQGIVCLVPYSLVEKLVEKSRLR